MVSFTNCIEDLEERMPGMAPESLRKRCLALSASRYDRSVIAGGLDAADGQSRAGLHLARGLL